MNKTVERIFELMKEHGDTGYTLERDAELPTTTIVKWRKGKFKPSADLVIKIAQYYNVSTDYLFCLTDYPTPPKTEIAERKNTFLSTDLAELAHENRFIEMAKMYKALSDEYRERVYGVVQGIIMGLGLDIQKILRR